MPYFLGVVGSDFSSSRARLRELRGELRQLEISSQRASAYRNQVLAEAASLRSAAIDSGMGEIANFEPLVESALAAIEAIADWVEPEELVSDDRGEELDRLRVTASSVRSEIAGLKERKDSAEAYAIRASSFADEGARQESRTKLLSLFGEVQSDPTCPLCGTTLADETRALTMVRESFGRLESQLSAVERQRPQLAAYLREIRESIVTQEAELRRVEAAIHSVVRNRQESRERESAAFRRARIAGRATEVLSSLQTTALAVASDARMRKLRREISKLESEFSDESIAERMSDVEAALSATVIRFAQAMDLEQSDQPIRFDLKEFQLRFTVGLQSVTLERIGAQKNWVGYHIAAILALQKWFADNNRPVPRFTVFDQVSQPFFSNESQNDPDRSEENLVDQDREQVMRLISQFEAFCKSEARSVQVILIEHVYSNEEWFRDALVERWLDGDALVPEDWPAVE